MSDIELVIKIDEETYKDIQSRDWKNGAKWFSEEWRAIHNGTLLPKGHGRLIDADKAIREENSKLVDFETTNTRDRSYCRYARMILNDAPTIIEGSDSK